jgi:hypothetical protein
MNHHTPNRQAAMQFSLRCGNQTALTVRAGARLRLRFLQTMCTTANFAVNQLPKQWI